MSCQLNKTVLVLSCALLWLVSGAPAATPVDGLIPPLSRMKKDHPRLLVRPGATPYAISLAQLRAIPHDESFNRMLRQLQGQNHAAAHAMVWLLTEDPAAADKAIKRMRAYHYPGKVDTFHYFFQLTELGLAYDWLYNCAAFTPQIKAEIRANVAPMARDAMRQTNDHMFHNYIWMSAGGLSLWAMATAGEDDASSQMFEQIRNRFNTGLYPAWQYLDGIPSEPMGYWSLYVFTPGVWTLLAAQSAYERDLVGVVRKEQGGWLDRNFENVIQSTLPDMRYIPWGDLQSGPNGGVTFDMAGVMDGATWALKSPAGRQFGQWLAGKRGLARFHADTAVFYMLYTRQLEAQAEPKPAWPGLSFLAGNKQSGHFIARSSWDDDATIVAFRCADHFGDHHHYDQGSFIIYRKGLLAVDPPVYRQVRGPQQKTEHHNTLLIGGKPQRPARGQWFKTVEEFKKNLNAGPKLETGDILWSGDGDGWAGVAGQFAQAYDCPELQSCVRQMLFIRPDKVVVVDRLKAAAGKEVPEVQWLLQFPAQPRTESGTLTASNGKSWIRCRGILPGGAEAKVKATPVGTGAASYGYPGGASRVMAHLLEVGEGKTASAAVAATAVGGSGDVEVSVGERKFVFGAGPGWAVTAKGE